MGSLHAVPTWSPPGPRGPHMVPTWSPRGPHTSFAWAPGENLAGTRWEPHGVPTWSLPRGPNVAPTRSPRGPHLVHVVPTWSPHVFRLGTRREFGGDQVGTTWGPHVVPPRGPHVVPTWPPRGPHVVPTWSTWFPRGPHVVPRWSPHVFRLGIRRKLGGNFGGFLCRGALLEPNARCGRRRAEKGQNKNWR